MKPTVGSAFGALVFEDGLLGLSSYRFGLEIQLWKRRVLLKALGKTQLSAMELKRYWVAMLSQV
ncbi:MAG TPA: hypothetical protein V6C50_06200 [Crinalium sp.]